MTAEVETADPATRTRAARLPRLRRFATSLGRQTFVDPVRAGRLRDLGWPTGLRAIVGAGYVMFGVAGLVVVTASAIRAHVPLVMVGTSLAAIPAAVIWPAVVVLSFGTAAATTASLHGPWWLKALGLLFALMVLSTWSLRDPSLSGWIGWLILAGASVLALLVFAVLRWRRPFAWWEFAVIWALIGSGMVLGLAETRQAKQYGNDLDPLNLNQTIDLLSYLALPAATVAGAAVAEITARATVTATSVAQRLTRPGWPYVILGLVLVVRAGQAVQALLNRDPVTEDALALLWAGVLVAAFAVLGLAVLRLARRRRASPVADELDEELSAVGFAVAAALLLVNLPINVLQAAVQILIQVTPATGAVDFYTAASRLTSAAVDWVRLVVGVVLILLALVEARRGRPTRALVLGCVGVVLVALARRLAFGDLTPAPINPDALNLVTSLVVVAAIVISWARRSLTPRRALGYAGVLILSTLFVYRQIIADPVAFLIGFSGAALVLVGLTWDLLTGAGWGNGESRRFPRPTRVLLVVTNSVLTMTVLAFAALARDTGNQLDAFAQFGDLVFGTGLLAAAVLAVLDGARREPSH